MWKIVRSAVDVADVADVAGIGIFAACASLYFYRGRELDGSALLEGGRNAMRFIRLRTPADRHQTAGAEGLQAQRQAGGLAFKGVTGSATDSFQNRCCNSLVEM